ncbi:MAG: ketoacyl-ACP synthase III [Candidatus Margulisiibacteriota bacterium]|nr:ketoacyl-ACP synthase III [Candidatus Margulisiibacteriota bacterium]
MYINCLKSYFPDEILDNRFFEERLDTTDDWIVSRVGIKERRRCNNDQPTLFLGVNAVSQIPKEHLEGVDCLVVGVSITQWQIPATANLIAEKLGLDGIPCFDVRAACSSFVYGLRVIKGLLATGFKKILFVVPEAYTSVVDYNDRSSSVLWGDGAIACVISGQAQGLEVLDLLINSKSSGAYKVAARVGGYFFQEGTKVQSFAVRYSIKVSQEMLSRNNVSSIDYLVLHQANLVMMKSVAKNLGIEENRLLHNIERYGNTGAVGAASVLAENWEKVKAGEKVLITVVGSGLSWGSVLLRKKG